MIEIKNLSKTHINSKTSQIPALKNISLELPDTGFVLITGESGSGKSTLLSILAGFDTIDSGSLVINGIDISNFKQDDLDKWRSFDTAFVFQEFNLISDYNIADNIKIGKNFQGEECSDEEIVKVLKDVKLQGMENRMFNDLSGGEKQRVAIARALVRKPKVLFVDEPSGQIDKENAKKILSILKKISKKVLVLCVSHDVDLVKKYSERLIKLKNGKITIDRKTRRTSAKKSVNPKKQKLLPKQHIEPVDRKIKHKRKHLINIGVNNILRQKTKVFSLILLSSAALLFFSVFYMLSGYNNYLALSQSILYEKPYYISFSGNNILTQQYNDIANEFDDLYFYRYANVNWQNGQISGLLEVPSLSATNQENIFGQEILFGKYPVMTQSNAFDIVITDYLAKQIIDGTLELRGEGGIDIINVTMPEQILGNCIPTVNNLYLTICGIIKTDYARYESAAIGSVGYDKFVNNLNTVYKTVHAAPGFINFFADFASINATQPVNISIKNLSSFSAIMASESFIGGKVVLKPDSANIFSGPLNSGEVIVSYDIYAEIKNNSETGSEVIFKIHDGNYFTYTITGVMQIDADDDSSIIFSQYDFVEKTDNVIKEAVFPISMLIINSDDVNARTLEKLICSLKEKYNLNIESSLTAFIMDFSDKMDILKSTFILFGVFSLAFACVLLYNYINIIITEKRKDIGIIRSLGATSKDIAQILFTTVSIIFITCFVLSAVFASMAAITINAFVMASVEIPFNIIYLNWDLYLLLFVSSLAICVIACSIPIIRYSTQTPQQQLKR